MSLLELALIAAMEAVDSQGRHVRLIATPDLSPKSIAAAARRTLTQLSTPETDPAVEANRLVNRRLCQNVIEAASK